MGVKMRRQPPPALQIAASEDHHRHVCPECTDCP